MAENALFNHAANVLAAAESGVPADAALRRYLGGTRKMGPTASRALSRAVFATFRWRQWLDPRLPAQARVAEAFEMQKRFDADPGFIKPEALAARAIPAWAHGELTATPDYLRQLQREPALWIRARSGMSAAVARALGSCTPAELPARAGASSEVCALRYRGSDDLFLTPAFSSGKFEIQDLASQWVGLACAPKPGESWWDTCAGEGGKTLHLADLLQNKGVVWATDRSFRRLSVLRKRAARAEAFNYQSALWESPGQPPVRRTFDGVLVDAPCSGVGTWQRNPHARWTTTLADVRELAAVQASLLRTAAARVKPGGCLVYAVCTLTRSETAAVADAFEAEHADFTPEAVYGQSASGPGTAAEGQTVVREGRLTLWPQAIDANGMFIARWRRAPAA